MKRYFVNFVRILSNRGDQDFIKNLGRLERHITRKHKPNAYYMVPEIGDNLCKHIHALIIFDDLEKMHRAVCDYKLSRLKAYIDDITIIPTEKEAQYYYTYINKSFIKEGENKVRITNVNYKYFSHYNLMFSNLKYIRFPEKNYIEDIFLED